MTFYERLETLRKSKKISQGDLEKELGFSNGSISKWKKSQPTFDRLKKLADYFGVSVEYLQNGKESGTNADMPYYRNDDAREMAQFMFDHPEYKVLFDATRNVKKEDIEFVKEMIERFTGNNK